MAGEFELIEWIRGQQQASPQVPVPAGDDLAVMRWNGEDLLLVGVDQVLEGVHFDLKLHTPRMVGRKVVNRNLSDCAAMACLPAAAVATVALPRGTSLEFAKELYLGMREAADRFGCAIVGGDTGSWEGKLAVTVTILGRSAGIAPVTRGGARPGDLIYVTGALGGSLHHPGEDPAMALGRHMTFEPRVELGRELGRTGRVTAMIDLSDGLSRDLGHLCRLSNVGAVIEADRVPIHGDAHVWSRQGGTPLEHALNDGEDYELLLTARQPIELPDLVLIGRTVAELGAWLEQAGRRQQLRPRGWEHPIE